MLLSAVSDDGERWRAGLDVYNEIGAFRYCPLVAAILALLSFFSAADRGVYLAGAERGAAGVGAEGMAGEGDA